MTKMMQMGQGKTVEQNVLAILRDCPEARYDDMVLYSHYYNNYSFLPAGELPLSDLAENYKLYGLPCFESIRRARQRVQSCYPELSRHPETRGEIIHIFVQIM